MLVLCLSVAFSSQASAEGKKKDDWFGGARFEFDLAAFFSNVGTTIRLDAANLPGTEFSFENDLGISDNDVSGLARFGWQISKGNNLSLAYFSLNRSGSSESRISITLPDPENDGETITIGDDVVVDSFFNADTTVLSYGYSFINNNKAKFGLSVGIHVTGIELGLATPNQEEIPDTAEDITAPLPTFGLQGGYRFGKNWYFTGNLGYFALTFDNIEGSITSALAGVMWQPFKLVGFGVNYQLFKVDVEATTDSFGGVGGEFTWDYSGPAVYVAVKW